MDKFKPTVCQCCSQTTNYLASLDRGSAMIVLALYNAVRINDRNRIHLRNDMECDPSVFTDYLTMAFEGHMTSKMIDNILRPKYHGLVAQVDHGGQGEYLITPKGARFLRNEPIIRAAVISKTTHSKDYYYDETDLVTFHELMGENEPWRWKLDLSWTERISPLVESPT